MRNKRQLWSAALIAFLTACVASRAALAVDEVEPNDPVGNAQKLVIGSDGTVTVNAEILNTLPTATAPLHRDTDFFTFQATKDNTLTVDIDGGINASYVGVATDLAIFGPGDNGPLTLLRQSSTGVPLDPGSVNPYDARIDNFVVPQTGTYVVGVTSAPATFLDADHLSSGTVTDLSPWWNVHGTYTLIISGVTAAIQQISIDIRPGRRDVLWADSALPERYRRDRDHRSGRGHRFEGLRRHFKDGIPVALLSSDSFDPMSVDRSSLKFGSTGEENSLIHCSRRGIDVNHDGKPDLICRFDFAKSDFVPGDNEGIVTGTTNGGDAFEGRGWLKIVTGERDLHEFEHHHDRDRDRH